MTTRHAYYTTLPRFPLSLRIHPDTTIFPRLHLTNLAHQGASADLILDFTIVFRLCSPKRLYTCSNMTCLFLVLLTLLF